MQTVQLKYDIISWITGLKDKNLILKLHEWMEEQKSIEPYSGDIIPPRREGDLTEGFGFWEDEAPFNEYNYRDKLWQTEKHTW